VPSPSRPPRSYLASALNVSPRIPDTLRPPTGPSRPLFWSSTTRLDSRQPSIENALNDDGDGDEDAPGDDVVAQEEEAQDEVTIEQPRVQEDPERHLDRDTSEDEAEIDIAQCLAEQLLHFQGCDAQKHEESAQQHSHETTNHVSLDEFNSFHDRLPDTLSSKILALRESFSHQETSAWKAQFLGTRSDSPDEKIHVCLSASELTEPRPHPEVTFDIDSIMGFPTSLAFAKRGLKFTLTPHIVNNLTADIHLSLAIPAERGSRRARLCDVVHTQFARVGGYEDATVFVFFPFHSRTVSGPTNYLSQHDLTRWIDGVILPALYDLTRSTITQGYPPSYRQAQLNSLAQYTETRARFDAKGRQQLLQYFLQPDQLDAIWERIGERQEPQSSNHEDDT
jgi:hypothetical protein